MFTDIVRGNQIRKVDQLERIVKFAFDNVGRTFSAASISKYLKSENRTIDNETVYSYLNKLESTEIDFIAIKKENKLYIQVTQEIGTPETEKREYGRLLDIRDNYPKYVLRTDAFAGGNYEGIKTMHVADFLLGDEF